MRTADEAAGDEWIGVFLLGQDMNGFVNAGRQLGLDVVTGDPVEKLLLVGHRFVDGVSARRKTLQFADRPAVTIAAIGTPRSENRLRIAEYDQQSQGNLKGPTHHINLRHLLTMSLPVGAIATA